MGNCNSTEGSSKQNNYLLEEYCEHTGGINCMALSEDGSVLVTGSEDKTARLWSTKTPHCECIGILKGHEDYINAVLIEDTYVLSGSADKTIRKWDINTCDCVFVFRGHNSLINRIICTGDFIFSSSYDRTARCWDFDTGECIRVFSGHKRGVYPLVFLPADDEDDQNNPGIYDWEGNKDILITGSSDFTAKSWSFETGKCLNTFKDHGGPITCMATDPMGKTLFTGSTDHTVRSWDIVKGEQLKLFEGHQGSVICLLVVNKIMYTGSSDHTGRAWVTEFGDCTRVFKGHRHTVSCVKFHEGLIFTSCGDGIMRIFSSSGSIKRFLKNPDPDIAVETFEIVAGKLFTGSYDGSLRVWDITGIKDDTTFGRAAEDNKSDGRLDSNGNDKMNGHTRIMIEDDPRAGRNGHLQQNGRRDSAMMVV